MIIASKRTVATTSKSWNYSRGKGKRSHNEPNEDRPKARTPDLGDNRKEEGDPNDHPTKNSKHESGTEWVRFTISSARLLPLIQSLIGFEWP